MGGRNSIGAMQQAAHMTRNNDTQNGAARDPRLLEGVLGNLPLFSHVPRAHVATVAMHSRVQHLRRGTLLCRRGEMMPGVIVLAYGSAKVALRRHGGEGKVVRFLGAGESFGEAAALHDRPCPVEVTTLSDSMVVVVPPLPLLHLVECDARFARNLVRILSERCLGLLGELEASLQCTALERLAAYLASHSEPNGKPDAWIVRLPASKSAVAARLGITKETLSRLLRELANRGLIAVSRREIEIRDRAALVQLAG